MPKRRDTSGHGARNRPDEPTAPPAPPPTQDEVERALHRIVERLTPMKPKPREPGPTKPEPERKARPSGRLSLVRGREDG